MIPPRYRVPRRVTRAALRRALRPEWQTFEELRTRAGLTPSVARRALGELAGEYEARWEHPDGQPRRRVYRREDHRP